jgi:hypothetical protein
VLSVFNTAAITIAQRGSAQDQQLPNAPSIQGLAPDEWLKAVVKGADGKSPRWRHLLLLGGVLLGFEGQNRKTLSLHLRKKLESAIVKAVAFALDEIELSPTIAAHTVVLVLNYTFELLSDWERSQINYDRLLPLFIDAAFSSSEGLESGYFLGVIDHDLREVEGKKFAWLEQSPSFQKIQSILSRPLVGGLGPLSRLVAHSVENVRDPGLVIHAMDRLLDFSRTLTVQWRLNKLSEIDPSEETEFLEQASLQKTLPTLWRLLRTSLFSIVIVMRAVLSRVLNDPVLGHDSREYRLILLSGTMFELTGLSTRRPLSCYEFSSHSPKSKLRDSPVRSECVLATYICLLDSHRHPIAIPGSLATFPRGYQAVGERKDTGTPGRAMSRSFLPQYRRAFHLGSDSRGQRKTTHLRRAPLSRIWWQ